METFVVTRHHAALALVVDRLARVHGVDGLTGRDELHRLVVNENIAISLRDKARVFSRQRADAEHLTRALTDILGWPVTDSPIYEACEGALAVIISDTGLDSARHEIVRALFNARAEMEVAMNEGRSWCGKCDDETEGSVLCDSCAEDELVARIEEGSFRG